MDGTSPLWIVAVSGLFVGFGLGHVALRRPVPHVYLVLLVFFAVKVVVDYRKCTVAYAECALRGVPREAGYLNAFLNGIVDIRNDCRTLVVMFVAAAIVFYSEATLGM